LDMLLVIAFLGLGKTFAQSYCVDRFNMNYFVFLLFLSY
jgi:hypothetical protein